MKCRQAPVSLSNHDYKPYHLKTLLSVMRGKWAIDQQYLQNNLPMIARLLKGEAVNFGLPAIDTNPIAELMYSPLYRVSPHTDLRLLADNSVVMVDVVGPITKYGDYCAYGSMDYAALMQRIDKADNIRAVILNIDSPGGEVGGTAHFGDNVKACSKLTIAFINDGYAASAAMWIASACDYIYCSHDTDMIGSIGVFCTLYDYKSYMEGQGLKIHEIYAPQSTEKNKEVQQALQGNYEPLQKELKVLADSFQQTVQTNRGDRLSGDGWKQGEMMFAPDAVAIGLIDGIAPLADIINMIETGSLHKGTTRSTKVSQQNSNKPMSIFGNKFPKLSALMGKPASEITAEDLNAANLELFAAGLDEDFAVMSTSKARQAETDLTTAQSNLTAAQNRIAEQETALQTAQAENETLKKQPGAFFAATTKKDDTAQDDDTDDVLANLEHNKKAAALGY